MRIAALIVGVIMAIAPVSALGSYEIVESKYADPYSIDLTAMPRLSSLPIDDPSDGINWIKIPLPKPCVNGLGGDTFILVRRGSSNNLLIFFEGGGACADYYTCKPMLCTDIESCKPLLGIGSVVALESKFWFLNLYYRGGIFDVKRAENPFRDWTIVFVPYNTGDLHIGNRVVKYFGDGETKIVYHVGYVNAIVAMRWIKENGNFDRIVIAGSSAGGYATLLQSYRAWEIFGKPVTVINDAGPGISPDKDSNFQTWEVMERWGSVDNFPPGAIPYITDRDPIYALEFGLSECRDCIYALFEDQKDLIIGSIFNAYYPWEYKARLLSVTNDIRSNFSERFCRFMPDDIQHTVLTGGILYPLQKDRFYYEKVEGYRVYQWVSEVLRGNCIDLIEN